MRCLVAVTLFVALVHLPARAQEFTPHHVAKLRLVTEAAISPDGKLVAYVLAVPRDISKEKDGPSWTELHVVDTNGESTPFITGQVNVSNLGWTPDGKSIAFLTKRDKDEHRALYLIGTRGGEARKVLSHSTDIQGYSFSGDGKRVAFLATEPTTKDKKKIQDQGFNQEIYEEDQPFTRVWIGNLGEPGASATGATPKMLNLEGSASEIHWNPKEDKIAVALSPQPLIDDQLMFRKVHIVDISKANLERKRPESLNLENPGKLGQVGWSPDGKKLAIISGADKHDPMQGQLWVQSTASKGWANLTPDFKGHVESFSWVSPDGILVQASVGVESVMGLFGIELTPTGSVLSKGQADMSSRIPRGLIVSALSAAKTGRGAVLVCHSSAHPPEVYLGDGLGKEPQRLTDCNPWLKTMRFAKQEVVKYKARDGLELEGILIHPLKGKPGEKHPLVLTVHGGPESHYSNGWLTLYHSLGQVGAAKGLAVFYPNYRGSTGRGVKFSMMGQAAAAGKEFDDLVDGVDHLVKLGLVDKNKVGITGGSYGGYATAWGATYYSDRFAAGVMFVGISDSVSKVGTTDIPWEMYLVHHRKFLWDDWDYFLKSSPIYHLDKARTPLLILHGKNDPRVHPSQSLELYRHLKIRGKAPVRLVLYPGEGHGNRRAASRLDYNIRLLQWMEHYLTGPGGAMPPRDINYHLGSETKTSSAGWDSRSPTTLIGRSCPCCIAWQ